MTYLAGFVFCAGACACLLALAWLRDAPVLFDELILIDLGKEGIVSRPCRFVCSRHRWKDGEAIIFFSCLDILGLGCLVSCRDVQRTRANPSLSISLQMAPSTNVDPVSFDFCLLCSYNINPWTYASLLYILTSAVVIPASVIVMSQLLPAELVLA